MKLNFSNADVSIVFLNTVLVRSYNKVNISSLNASWHELTMSNIIFFSVYESLFVLVNVNTVVHVCSLYNKYCLD